MAGGAAGLDRGAEEGGRRKDAFGLSNWGPSLTEPVFGEPGNIANIKELKPR